MDTPAADGPRAGASDIPDLQDDERQLDRRVSKAVEEEQAFLEYIASLPAMSSENVEAFKKKEAPELAAAQESGLETLDNLYKLMEHLGRLRRQNSKLQKRLQYLENADADCEESSRSRRFSSKTKTLIRTISKDDATTNVTTVKSKVSKWTKVKEAFRWEKASGGVLLPEAASQDSGLGGGDFHLRPPGDRSSFSFSPADSVLSGPPPRLASSLSTSEDELELDLSDCGQKRRKLSIEKNVYLGVEEDETRRSKSLDGESIESASGITDHHSSQSKETRSSHQQSQKVHKTPWSKVKDIIQTRTGSIKKKKGADADADDECPVDIFEGEDREFEYKNFELVLNEDTTDPNSEVSQRMANICNRKRLAPVLTITLPSTEELRPTDHKAGVSPTPTNKNGKPPPSPQVEEKYNRMLMRQKTLDDTPTKDNYKKQVASSSAGTSPPTPRRKSKWSKVKNAFLTTTPSPEDLTAHFSNSTPSSPINKCTSFLYDLESDELSSSEFIDENLQENNDNVFVEAPDDNFNMRCQQSSTQKNLEDLHLRFSNEFHQKLSEWERIRNSGTGISSPPSAGKVSASGLSSGTSSVGEEEKKDKRRGEEWDKMKSCRKRESLALQQLGEENLSPDFKKKLEQWEKIKAVPVSPTQESSPVLQPQSKKKITDWQRWRPGSSSTKNDNHSHNIPQELPEEFSKRLQDWDRIKHGTSVECEASQKPTNRTPSPGVSHDVVFEHKSRKIQHRLSETKEKWADTGHKVLKSKSHHEMKELAWLEKELHKIEREKQRLERERDKYLEREARLQKMRRAIGSTQQKQEVVIPTSTGVFRFEGISQKFTKKLYEWEKARGIGPEASTIALLDPGYKPQSGESISGETLKKNGALLLRSKSMGSVVDIAGGGGCQSPVITHQPSSLSLNNMEEIGNTQIIGQDPDSCLSDKEDDYEDYYDGDEPGAVIVDIEDVVEETASPLAQPPAVITEIPVYCYAPAEVTRLIDSSGSENELSSENMQSSYCILQENIDLLDELKKKEDICRRIEIRMENIEEKMQSTANFREKQLESLSMDEQNMDKIQSYHGEDESTELDDIKSQLKILDDHQEALKQEEETLQYSFVEHSEQQAVLAQSLVDNMRQLQEVNNCMSTKDTPDTTKENSNDRQEEALAKVQDLTGQLLTMAERLEVIVGERNKEILRLRETISPSNTRRPYLSQHSLSTDSITISPGASSVSRLPRQSSEELSQLPTMLTSKVLELKRGLTYLCAVSDAAMKAVSQTCDINDISHNSESTKESKTVSEMPQSGFRAPSGFAENFPSYEKEESESEFKSTHEDHLIVGCLTLPALRLRKSEEKLEIKLENDIINPSSDAIGESKDCERTQKSKGCDSIDKECENKISSTEIVSEKIDECRGELKKERKVKIERQSLKDSTRKTRFSKCTMDGSNNLRGRRVKRETSSESSSKYEEEGDGESSLNSRVQYDDSLEAEAMKLKITESIGKDASLPEESNSNVGLQAPLVTESTPQSMCNRDGIRSSQILAATGTSEPVDVFVPTTRKIFSPVRRDSKGKASSVISYIVRENALPDQVPLSPRRVRRRNEQEDKAKGQNKNEGEEDESKRESINFVMPPCWILRETRAQSASPALQRRNLPVPRSREKHSELDFTSNKKKNVELKIEDEESKSDQISSQSLPVPNDSLVNKSHENTRMQENKFGSYGAPTSPTPPTPPLGKKYSVLNRENMTGESTDKNSCEAKPQPIRKSRTEIGFPPISPIPGRREVKLSKETAPSIRMIIARYNQKVSESQEMLGSKSPDSGSGSPLPWRSPGAERRVRVQMEKYQDEVRRALQGNEGRRQNFSGEVKKSASASFIRSFEKGSLQDRFGRRPSDSLSERQTSEMRYNGILKSSSAGSIKPGTPVPQRREVTTPEKLDTTHIPPSQCTLPVQDQLSEPSESRLLETEKPVLEKEYIDEKINRENEHVCVAEPTGSRALRIKRAKEEFLSRGPGGSWSTTDVKSTMMLNTLDGQEGGGGWSQEKSRLSRVSCESDVSCEGILVSGEEQRQPFDSRLLVKSASAGMINIDSLSFGSILPESTSNSSVPSGSSEQGAGSSKSKFGFSNIASRFRKVKMRRHKEKEREKMETVSTLCRQSLLVDIQKRKSADKRDKVVSSKSCPSSPVLQKRESNSSWSISPRRIFKPK